MAFSPSSVATTLICGFNTCFCRVSLCIFHTASQFSGSETTTSPEPPSPLSFLPHLLRAKGQPLPVSPTAATISPTCREALPGVTSCARAGHPCLALCVDALPISTKTPVLPGQVHVSALSLPLWGPEHAWILQKYLFHGWMDGW